MSILIRGMEMPSRCADCWLMDGDDGWCCACRGKQLVCDYRYGIKARPEWCPLVPVPPHGRLIDADVLAEKHTKLAYEDRGANYGFHITARAWVDSSPTIIPASEEARNG